LEFFEPEPIENTTDRSKDNSNDDFTVGIPNTEVDKEIEEAIIDCNSVRYTHPIKREFQDFQEAEIVVEFDQHHYNLNKGSPIEKLTIEIGGNKIARYSCGNHKLNLALRHAIQLQEGLSTVLYNLNKSNTHVRNTIKLNKVNWFRDIYYHPLFNIFLYIRFSKTKNVD
jgi:hypothetical protein